MPAAKKNKPILVFSAHSDDFVLGLGGTIAKYTNQGYPVYCYIFSYGELSHPWLGKAEVRDFRSKEAFAATKVLGCETKFFDLKETNFVPDAKKKDLISKLSTIIQTKKPCKIFTHSIEDPHPDHKAVHALTMQVYDLLRLTKPKFSLPQIFVYSIWNPVEFKTTWPALYVDISKTFKTKIKALKKFPSQRFNAIYPLFTLVLFRAIRDGFKIRRKFAEKFYLVKDNKN